jgi:hypothetical protein
VGILVHRVLENWERGEGTGDPLEFFDTEYARLRADLEQDASRRHFADLAATKGSQGWARLRSWVGERCRQVERRVPRRTGAAAGAAIRWDVPLGPERRLSSDRLRLGGQADRVRALGAHSYEIRDYKSGNAVDNDGEVKPAIQIQLRAYGLLVLELDPKASVRLVVDDGGERDVAFDATAQAQAREEILDIVARVPPPGTVDARDLARPGAGCHGCPIRHVCPAYREAAPAWWRSIPSDVQRVPDDIWGTLTEVLSNPETLRVDLLLADVAGRRVRIDGLDARHDAAGIPTRSRVWLFGLQATGRPRGYDGKRFHPRVFHELPRDAHERRAWSTILFVER